MVQDDPGQILVFTYDYEAGEDFEVLSQLETSTTVQILQTAEEETVPEISQPDEYVGHVVRYQVDGGPVSPTTLVFIRNGSISTGETGTLGEEATMFSPTLNLLSTDVE
ncbi:hypothetical protein Htur_0074 [Haloterrigena turkmenica DSM 5511]|uniref:Uncharacterized protein n=1 Tax=Haloterrigena turkmenica (strain ATCC 51198 / DSM 5511 / JCM 9101 / NCIMB 13204 / VKM B-1734 / 4k) TaxID=543526 RepID=D2RTD2_HALTV|nr:hypothetical protein [Haloterrigena turkmenica]ADB58975.1 hypothetical protein Htur_0074 [Haloterrigena turkmenica DSM 5511]